MSVVWNWFMPFLFGLPTLTLIQALALDIVVSMLVSTTSKRDKSQSNEEYMIDGTIRAFIIPLVYLVFAWIVKLVGGF